MVRTYSGDSGSERVGETGKSEMNVALIHLVAERRCI